MIEKANSPGSIVAMLKSLQAHATQASGLGQDAAAGISTPKTDFSELIRQAIGQTNATQLDSQNTSQAFERGEAVPLTDVVLKMQKASLSFEATLQVRNKVLKAYEDVMNMPV